MHSVCSGSTSGLEWNEFGTRIRDSYSSAPGREFEARDDHTYCGLEIEQKAFYSDRFRFILVTVTCEELERDLKTQSMKLIQSRTQLYTTKKETSGSTEKYGIQFAIRYLHVLGAQL